MSKKRAQDLEGMVFGKLTVIRFVKTGSLGKSKFKRSWWLCKCECGNEITMCRKELQESPHNRSCGCLLLAGRGPLAGQRPIEEAYKYAYNRLMNLCKWNGECLEWQGYCNLAGTPATSFLDKVISVRRLLWIIKYGEPESMITYSCGNPKCVNINHCIEVKNNAIHRRKKRNYKKH